MKRLADGVWQLAGKPENGINAYVIGDVLVDSGLRTNAKNVLAQLSGRTITAHALTHAHFDHFGSSHAVCAALGIPMWVGTKDVAAVETGKMVGRFPLLGERMLPAAPRQQVTRSLEEGDEVAGFKVLFTPGHSPGHISFWRESDRVLLCGDVLWGMNPVTGRGGPREPLPLVSPDPRANRDSARRLAELRPELVAFGHGPPLRDPAAFAAVVAKLRGAR